MLSLYILIIADILGLAVAQLMLKKGMMIMGPIDFSIVNFWNVFLAIFKNTYLFGGLFLAGISFLLWLFILSKVNVNIIYPISASATLVVVIFGSYLLLKENVNLIQLIGMAVIILGIFLVYYKNNL